MHVRIIKAKTRLDKRLISRLIKFLRNRFFLRKFLVFNSMKNQNTFLFMIYLSPA